MGNSTNRPSGTSDAQLVAHARSGEAAALGILLERHRPRLLATAIRILGVAADAEDAVQETFFIAMCHLHSVRDPLAVGSWLQMVVRRTCLQMYRRRRAHVTVDVAGDYADERPRPDEILERMELRDWIWGALEALPEALRITAMLRYFGSYDSYNELAAILGVPIGTVRSRLSEAKLKLAEALLATAGLMDDDARRRARERAQFWTGAFAEIFDRGASTTFVSHFAPNLAIAWSNGTRLHGREHLAAEIEGDLATGVRLDVTRVLCNDGVTIVEGRFVNPPESPEHCPPGMTLVLFESEGRGTAIRMHLSPRPPHAGAD